MSKMQVRKEYQESESLEDSKNIDQQIYEEEEEEHQQSEANEAQTQMVKQEEGVPKQKRPLVKFQNSNRAQEHEAGTTRLLITRQQLDKMFEVDRKGERIDPTELINLRANKQFEYRPPRVSTQYLRMHQQNKPKVNHPYRVRDQNTDVTSMRYECFCRKTYLSYCAFYFHLKTHHPKFLSKNRKFSASHIVTIIHPQFGYKIKKLMPEKISDGPRTVMHADRSSYQDYRSEKPQILKKSSQTSNREPMRGQDDEEVTNEDMKIQLKQINSEMAKQTEHLDYLQKAVKIKSEIVNDYQQIVKHYENILKIINIEQINTKLIFEEEVEYQFKQYQS